MEDPKQGTKQWSTGEAARRSHRRRKPDRLTAGERRRLCQLLVCLLLFGVVFIGRGAPEGQLRKLGDSMSAWVHEETDFRAVFSKVGQSFSDGEPFVETVGLLWSEMLGLGQEGAAPEEGSLPPPIEGEGGSPAPTEPQAAPAPEENPPVDVAPAEEVPAQPAAPPAQPVEPTADVPATDANSGLLSGEIVTPVMGTITSPFGYRTHPIDGAWKEHEGIDIMANEGTPILAFAAGEVEYIGESEAYGLYLRLRHADGVNSFYAHCSELLVKQGQSVAAGETVAKVGATGNVTGAHLHLELKKDGAHIDPASYVQSIIP